ncbi:hypothetical protein [Undibacterium sp.]|jgi:hypothetical protein|uniref:hypothetical protein n=1 Tax=Undibacterium sp. TaxID=1914977 RepID=UPI002CCD6E0A|nr:hypothetical protein [Undibacterium sp.]HTD05259.1 hypothetical protein [Undibacterium sp.]
MDEKWEEFRSALNRWRTIEDQYFAEITKIIRGDKEALDRSQPLVRELEKCQSQVEEAAKRFTSSE